MTRLILLMFGLAAQLTAQLSATRTATMRYNDNGSALFGDTWRCSTKVEGLYYCTWNDGGWYDRLGSASGNIGVGVLSLDLTNVFNTSYHPMSSLTAYGGSGQFNTNGWTNGSGFKSGGLDFRNGGKLYLAVQQQCQGNTGDCSGLTTGSGIHTTIIVSDDLAVHWCNPKTWAANGNTCPHNSTTAKGDPPQGPTLDGAVMWPGNSHMADMQLVQYQASDSADQNSSTCYWLSRSSKVPGILSF